MGEHVEFPYMEVQFEFFYIDRSHGVQNLTLQVLFGHLMIL